MTYKPAALVVALLISLGSTACSVGEVIGGDKVRGDSNTVTVQARGALDALPLATLHCSSFHKSAQYSAAQSGSRYTYRCI
jgi:hypothetical protein